MGSVAPAFDRDAFVAACHEALSTSDPFVAVVEIVERAVTDF